MTAAKRASEPVDTGGGHTWPSGLQYLPSAIIGRTARDFDASTVIGAFFLAHR